LDQSTDDLILNIIIMGSVVLAAISIGLAYAKKVIKQLGAFIEKVKENWPQWLRIGFSRARVKILTVEDEGEKENTIIVEVLKRLEGQISNPIVQRWLDLSEKDAIPKGEERKKLAQKLDRLSDVSINNIMSNKENKEFLTEIQKSVQHQVSEK